MLETCYDTERKNPYYFAKYENGNVSFIDPNYVAGDQNPAQFGKTEGMYPGGIDAELTILDDGTSSFKRQEYDPLKSLGGLLGLFTGGGFQDDYDNYKELKFNPTVFSRVNL